jgi:anti-sigma factor RsiW
MFRDLVFDFLDGTLRDRAAFDAHRASCPACAESLRGIESNEKALAAARAPLAPAGLWPAIAARISEGRALPFRRTKIAAGLAAAAALLLSVTIFFSEGSPRRRLHVVVQEVTPEAGRAFSALVPRYEDIDTGTAMAETLFR